MGRRNAQGPIDYSESDYSESEWSPLLSLSIRVGSSLWHTFPCLLMGTYFLNFPQSCSLRAFTGTHPVLRGMPTGHQL